MTKYLSLAAILGAMIWTWGVQFDHLGISETMHMALHDDLKRYVENRLTQEKPGAKNLAFERVWTEAINPNQIKVSFIYTFEEESADQQRSKRRIEGSTRLTKSGETADTTEWSFDEWTILNDQLEFEESLRVTPREE